MASGKPVPAVAACCIERAGMEAFVGRRASCKRVSGIYTVGTVRTT